MTLPLYGIEDNPFWEKTCFIFSKQPILIIKNAFARLIRFRSFYDPLRPV